MRVLDEHIIKEQKDIKAPERSLNMGQKVYTNRKFRLLAENERDNVDLREYKDIIENTIQEIAPNTRITVRRDYYMLDCVTQSQIVQIGRLLAKTEINKPTGK